MPISLPSLVDERAAGVAGVDGGVGLNHVPERHAAERRELAAEPGDDAAGHGRAAQPERVAEGNGVVAEAQRRGAADLDRLQIGRVDADDREVTLGRGAEHPSGELCVLSVREDDRHALGVLDDVVVGEDRAVAVDDDTGALALTPAADEVLEEAAAFAELHPDVHERGKHALDHVRDRPG